MFHNSNLQKTIGQWITAIFASGATLFFIVFVMQSSSLSSASETTQRVVGLGPLHFVQITKTINVEGTSASFELLPGILGYILILALLASIGGWYCAQSSSRIPGE
jgi:hypothetical protein